MTFDVIHPLQYSVKKSERRENPRLGRSDKRR